MKLGDRIGTDVSFIQASPGVLPAQIGDGHGEDGLLALYGFSTGSRTPLPHSVHDPS